MPPNPMDITPETVRLHTSAMRAVAMNLLRDEHAANDVVQETWLAALAHREQRPEATRSSGPGPWLRTVARRLAARRLRTEVRREGRERTAARDEALTGDEAMRRTAVFRAVTSSILELDEPYRETLLMRFVEDRPPREIALALDLPLATVKSRLARGVDRVRESVRRRLENEGIDYVGGLALLCGLPRIAPPLPQSTQPGATSATGTGALMPKLSFLLLPVGGSAAALLAATAIWLTPSSDESDPTRGLADQEAPASTGTVLAGEQEAAAPVLSALPSNTVGGARRIIPADKKNTAAVEPAELEPNYQMTVLLTDSAGMPVFDAEIFAAPRSTRLNSVGRTDMRGRLQFEFHGATGRQALALAARTSNGNATRLLSLKLQESEENQLFLSMHEESRGTALTLLHEGSLMKVETDVFLTCDFSTRFQDAPDFDLDAAVFLDTSAELTNGFFEVLNLPSRTTNIAIGVLADLSVESEAIVDIEADGVFLEWADSRGHSGNLPFGEAHEIDAYETDAPKGRASGQITRPDGTPAASVLVRAISGEGNHAAETHTDEDGFFLLPQLPLGPVTLLASGAGLGHVTGNFPVKADEELRWIATLDEGRVVSGRLLGEDDKPLAGRSVEWFARMGQQTWRQVARTSDDGSFRFTNAPDAPAKLSLRSTDAHASFAAWSRDNVWPGQLGTSLIPTRKQGSLELTTQATDGSPIASAELRLWRGETNEGLAFRSNDEGVFALEGLPQGSYEARVGFANEAWSGLGSIWIGDEPLDLGTLVEPAPAILTFSPDLDLTLEGRFGLWRRAGDGTLVLNRTLWLPSVDEEPTPIELAPGDYVLSSELEDSTTAWGFTALSCAELQFVSQPAAGLGLSIAGTAGTETTAPVMPQNSIAVLRTMTEELVLYEEILHQED